MNTYETLAAVAVFRELYDSNKDIYDVLSLYVKEVILSEHLASFTCPEITEKINRNNSFKINESVVKTALKRLSIPRERGVYTVPEEFLAEKSTEAFQSQVQQNKVLFDDLVNYVEGELGNRLSENEIEVLKENFFDYIIKEDTSKKYSIYISKYIMSVSVNSDYYAIINRIKEGTLIYEGICYSGNVSELGKWTSELNIYLELEVLFYIVGYNGEVHKALYHEFIDYVREINSAHPKRKKYINLWYTENVQSEIETYFSTAEHIFEKGEPVDPTRRPMMYILDGVRSKSDIVAKKVSFYKMLQNFGVMLFKYDYYSAENSQYSIVNESTYSYNKTIVCEREEEYVERCTDKLNQIEILRKRNNIGIDYVKHIILTANSVILKLAFAEGMYNKGEVPKATDVDFLINRFWFKLNKGFGKGLTPKTIDIITRARMVLSFITSDNVSRLFDEVCEKYKKGTINREEATALIATLRDYSVTPDEIDEETISSEIDELNDFDITKKLEEMKREEIERKADKEKIIELEKLIVSLQDKANENDVKKEQKISQLCQLVNNTQVKNDQLEQTIMDMVERNKKEEERKAQCKKRWKIALLIIFLFVGWIGIFFLLVRLFEIERSISGVISIAVTILFESPTIISFFRKKVDKDSVKKDF